MLSSSPRVHLTSAPEGPLAIKNGFVPPQLFLAQRLHNELMQAVQLNPDQHRGELLIQGKDVVDDLVGLPQLGSAVSDDQPITDP